MHNWEYTQYCEKTVECEVQQVVGEMDEDPFDVIILKGKDDAIDRKGTKYNFRFYDPTFLRECTDFVELLYGDDDLYEKEYGCWHGPHLYIYVNYGLGLVINDYKEHLNRIDPYDYEHEQLLELINFALQDEDSGLVGMVTDDDFIKELSEKIHGENKIIELSEDDFEEVANFNDVNSVSIPKEVEIIDDDFEKCTIKERTPFVPKNKKLKFRYSQTWQGNDYSEEDGISLELYNYAVNYLGFMATDIPSFLGCTHVFETEDGDIYGFIEQKE